MFRKVFCIPLLIVSFSFEVFAESNATPLKIGVSLPLSGSVAAMGQGFRKGFDLYIQDNPESSKDVRFIFEDHKYDGKTAVSVYHKFREIDKTDFVIVWGNTPSGVCAPIAERMKLPLLAVTFDAHAKDRKHVVTFGPKTERMVNKLLEKFNTWNVSNPGAVSIDVGNALAGVEMMKQKLDGNLFVKIVSNEETDFKTIITTLRSKKIDTLFLLTFPQQALNFIKQSVQLNYFPKIIGGDVFADQNFREGVTDKLKDVFFVYGAVEKPFIERLKDKYADSSYFYETASGYSLAALFHRLAVQDSKLKKEDLIDSLRTVALSNVPVLGLKLLEDNEYGLHFENESAIYSAHG